MSLANHQPFLGLPVLILDFVQNLNRSCPEPSFKPQSQTPTVPPPPDLSDGTPATYTL